MERHPLPVRAKAGEAVDRGSIPRIAHYLFLNFFFFPYSWRECNGIFENLPQPTSTPKGQKYETLILNCNNQKNFTTDTAYDFIIVSLIVGTRVDSDADVEEESSNFESATPTVGCWFSGSPFIHPSMFFTYSFS